MDHLLIVGAHALDAEVMAGAIAAVAREQNIPVHLLHLTRGERGHPSKPVDVFGPQLEVEMQNAADKLGVDQCWANIPAPLQYSMQLVDWIKKFIQDYDITAVITHWSGSWHPSHVITHLAVINAVQSIHNRKPSLFFAENSEDLLGYKPVWYIPVDSVMDRWVSALMCYELFRLSLPETINTEAFPYWGFYTSLTTVRGKYVGLKKAQTLMGEGKLPSSLPAVYLPGV